MTSASWACVVNWAPACASMPIMTSLSTRFFGQPRLTNPTFFDDGVSEAAVFSLSDTSVVLSTFGMQFEYFSIHALPAYRTHGRHQRKHKSFVREARRRATLFRTKIQMVR